MQSSALTELDNALAADPETNQHLSNWKAEVQSWSIILLAGKCPPSDIRSPYMIEEDEGEDAYLSP